MVSKNTKFSTVTVRLLMIFFLIFILSVSTGISHTAFAQEPDQKIVRAGWYESSFCYRDQFGRRSGIDYEYQHKISAYTGWTYEYVEDSWSNLLQMLINGEIDLLSDVSYTEERTAFMSFPDLPMGAEAYYIYIAADNSEITAQDLTTFNGKRIGVNRGSVQEGFLDDWAERNNITIEAVPLVVGEAESLDMLISGELDGYATIYTMGAEQNIIPLCRIGESYYYYAVNKDRPDLLAELNMALAGIQDEDPYFNQKISEEHQFNTTTKDFFLTPEQEAWLRDHGTIRIGYRDNFLPFCSSDKETGELTGALKDYLAHAANNLRNSDISFTAVPYPSTDAALEAMKNGEIDCVFPVNMSSYDSDEMGIRLTSQAMKTELQAVMRNSDNRSISRDSTLTFAVNAGDPNADTFVMGQYPKCSRKYFPDDRSCFEAVASRDADCALVSNYRLPAVEDIEKKFKLYSVPTGESMPLSFAVSKADRDLYFILNKTAVITKSEDMDSALASYMHSNRKVSLTQFLKDNWIGVIIGISAVFFVIIFLLLQKLNAERKANEQQRAAEEAFRREMEQKEQLQSAIKLAYTDSLTGVKSKRAYKEAEESMNQRIAEGSVSEFSLVIFDLNDLKLVNDSRGHESGDAYIKDASKLICSCFKHSPIFRVGGDEFIALLEGEDYSNQDELLDKFEKQILENIAQGRIVVAFGCSRFAPEQDKDIQTVFERADENMYFKKKELKSIQA